MKIPFLRYQQHNTKLESAEKLSNFFPSPVVLCNEIVVEYRRKLIANHDGTTSLLFPSDKTRIIVRQINVHHCATDQQQTIVHPSTNLCIIWSFRHNMHHKTRIA